MHPLCSVGFVSYLFNPRSLDCASLAGLLGVLLTRKDLIWSEKDALRLWNYSKECYKNILKIRMHNTLLQCKNCGLCFCECFVYAAVLTFVMLAQNPENIFLAFLNICFRVHIQGAYFL